MRRLFFALAFIATQAHAAGWITGYYPTWFYGGGMANQMDFSIYTHVIIFPAQDALATYPYFNPSYVLSYSEFDTTIAKCRRLGVVPLFSIVGGWGNYTNLNAAASTDSSCKSLVDATCAFLLAHNLGGIDIDWEFPYAGNKTPYNRLIRMFRQKFDTWNPKGVMTGAFYYSTSAGAYDWDSVYAAFDQVNLMTYTMWQGSAGSPVTGFDTPVDMPTTEFPGYGGVALNSASGGPLSYPRDKRSKIGIGLSFEATHFQNRSAMNVAYDAGNWGFDYPSNVPATVRTWNAQAQAFYCINGTNVWSYPDTNSMKAGAKWAKDSLFAGVMVYNICEGYNGTYFTPADALSRAVYNGWGGGSGTYTPPSTRPHYWRRKR